MIAAVAIASFLKLICIISNISLILGIIIRIVKKKESKLSTILISIGISFYIIVALLILNYGV